MTLFEIIKATVPWAIWSFVTMSLASVAVLAYFIWKVLLEE